MNKTLVVIGVTVLSAALSACGSKDSAPSAPAVGNPSPPAPRADAPSTPSEAKVQNVLGADPSLSCEDAHKQVAAFSAAPPTSKAKLYEYAVAATKSMSCATLAVNANEKNKTVIVGNVSPDTFELEPVEQLENREYKDACKVAAGAAMSSGNLTATDPILLAGAAGASLTCDAYVEAIAAKDPIIIVGPAFVQGKYVTKEVLTQIGMYDEAKKAGQKVEDYVKDNPEKVALFLADPVTAATKEIIDKNLEGTKRAGQSTIDVLRGKKKLW